MSDLWQKKIVALAVVLALAGVSSVAMADEEEPEVAEEAEVSDAPEETEVAQEEPDEDDETESVDEPADEPAETDEPDETDETDETEPAEEDETEPAEEDEAEPADEPAEQPGEPEVAPEEPAEPEETVEEPVEPVEDVVEEQQVTEPDADEEVADLLDEEEDEEEVDEERPFSPTLAIGLETGYFFTDLARFNEYLLVPNDADPFSVISTQHVDLVVESEVVENLRLSILGGMTFAWQDDPSLFGWYVGLEPAFVAGDDVWQMAIGSTVGVGGLRVTAGEDQVATSVTVLRPFLEVRRSVADMTGLYVRAGFNQWFPRNPRSETFDVSHPSIDRDLAAPELGTGGLYISAGFRFGALQGLDQLIGNGE